MKTYTYSIGGQRLRIAVSRDGSIDDITLDGARPCLSAEEMARYAAAISLALFERDAATFHDEETATAVTITRQPTPWFAPEEQAQWRE